MTTKEVIFWQEQIEEFYREPSGQAWLSIHSCLNGHVQVGKRLPNPAAETGAAGWLHWSGPIHLVSLPNQLLGMAVICNHLHSRLLCRPAGGSCPLCSCFSTRQRTWFHLPYTQPGQPVVTIIVAAGGIVIHTWARPHFSRCSNLLDSCPPGCQQYGAPFRSILSSALAIIGQEQLGYYYQQLVKGLNDCPCGLS